MKLRKIKLLSSIASVVMVLAVLSVGVWATASQSVNVNTTVTFTATEAGSYTFSIDSTVGVLGINYEMNVEHTVSLAAGESLEITVMTNENNGTQVVELTILLG